MVVRNFRITTQHGAMEGKTQSRDVAHYNLDMIIALGYRVQSQVATRFRRWATQRLHEYTEGVCYGYRIATLESSCFRILGFAQPIIK